MSTAFFYSLSIFCQYLTLYRLLVLCHYVHWCLLRSVHYLLVPHTLLPVGSMSLCPLLTSKVCPLSVSTLHSTVCWFRATMSTAVFYCLLVPHTLLLVGSMSLCPLLSCKVCPLSVNTLHSNVCWFCVTMSTAVFYSLSTVCQYLTLYRLLVLCHYVHWCLLQSVQYLLVPHILLPVCSMSLCPLLSSTVCPLSVSTLHSTVWWFCVTMSTAAFYCLLVPHTLLLVGSMSLCPLLSSKFCPLSVNTLHSTVCWFCVTMSTVVFYSLSSVCQYLILHHLLFLCHYVHWCLLYSVRYLLVPHTLLPVGSMSLCPLLSSTICPLSVSILHSTDCWFCVITSTAVLGLSPVCQYLTLYRLLFLCHYIHCCLLQSVHCLSVPYALPSVGSVSLCPLLSYVCPLSVSTSHCTACWFCVTMSTADF
jgi:hypothetical protein